MNLNVEARECEIAFEEGHPPVLLKQGSGLSEHLNIKNSPVLFGCRTGICGTCAIEITKGLEALQPRTQEEDDLLEVLTPGRPECRLACQIRINTDIRLRKISV